MALHETILVPGVITVDVQLQPALNVLNSHMLLGMASIRSGLDSWVYDTSARLSPEQQKWVKILYWGVPGVVTFERTRDWTGFEELVDAYEAADPTALIMEEARVWHKHQDEKTGIQTDIPLEELILKRERYLELMREVDDPALTDDIILEAHRFLSDPVTMHLEAAAHLREMWAEYLKPEWDRRLSEVQAAIAAISAFKTPSTLVEAVRRVTGRDISAWMVDEGFAELEGVIFMPSPHMGPYITGYETNTPKVNLFCIGASIPAANPAQSGPAEFQARLLALADPVRLQIAELLASRAGMSTEEIMAAFDLNKSAASRHLRLLTATGLINERREGGAKKVYSANRDTALNLIRALEAVLLQDA